MKLASKVAQLLQSRPDAEFTTQEIAKWLFETFPDECAENRRRRTKRYDTDKKFVTQLSSEINSKFCHGNGQKQYPRVRITDKRPKTYFWSTELPADQEQDEPSDPTSPNPTLDPSPARPHMSKPDSVPLEHELYPLLLKYLRDALGIDSIRIDEKVSSNTNGTRGNQWLYPDIVGVENLTAKWHSEIKELVKESADKKARLWSFEVKRTLNRSNVRQAYFQAVSNSSWANFGYLAAAEIEGTDTIEELRMLYGLHGIGLVQIDTEAPDESSILIPAREKPEVDMTTCNRLVTENKDFHRYVKSIRHFYQTGDLMLGGTG